MGVTEKLLAQIHELKAENSRLAKEADWLADLLVDLKICPTVKIFKCRYQDDKDYPRSECVKCWRGVARQAAEDKQ